MSGEQKCENLSYNFSLIMSPNNLNGGRVARNIIHKGREKVKEVNTDSIVTKTEWISICIS